MKISRFFIFLLALGRPALQAQPYTIDWHKIAGGGGTSTGGTYSVSGTVGQHDASAVMLGGGFSLTGGFWSVISVVQSPGVPNLLILAKSPDTVQIL